MIDSFIGEHFYFIMLSRAIQTQKNLSSIIDSSISGIWSHTRLAASNLAQLLLVISLPLFIAALATDAVREIYSFELNGDNTPKV